MKRCATFLSLFLLAGAALAAAPAPDESSKFDWPQWQGPTRDAVSRETGLLKEWPKDGPPLAWKVKGLGGGYSSPSVAAGRIFGMSYRGNDEVVWALGEKDGKELWVTPIDRASHNISQPGGEGSRCTPTVDGDYLYALGTAGDLVCLKVADGKEVWHKNLTKDFGGSVPRWGYSESPLVDGDKLIVTPGGKEATLAALDKKTGETVWKAQVPGGLPAGYSSVIAFDFGGQRQYAQLTNGGLVGVAAADGAFLWRYDRPANRIASISTPIFHDGQVFAASDYGAGGGGVKLTKDGKGVRADEVWSSRSIMNQHGGVILHDGYLYGANGGNEGGPLVCLDWNAGKLQWDKRDRPRQNFKGSIALADGRLYYRLEDSGTMLLIEPSGKEYVERGRFEQPERSGNKAWPHPVIANGKLYLRDQGALFCYDVKAK
jgi:outer membrane protein assembly factor BamB